METPESIGTQPNPKIKIEQRLSKPLDEAPCVEHIHNTPTSGKPMSYNGEVPQSRNRPTIENGRDRSSLPITGNGAIDGAAATLFAAGIAARTKGKILWVITRPDLFAPALAQAGLAPDRVIYVEAGNDKTVLACVEEGLRHGGLGAVVGEVTRLDMTASRRLQLCAEETSTIGIALRRWRRQTEACDFGQPTATMTRWRISLMPSAPLPVPGVGRHR
ncbi:hypothetical protein ACVWYH_005137 [Bradyrhizobium sp. GM24.11]